MTGQHLTFTLIASQKQFCGRPILREVWPEVYREEAENMSNADTGAGKSRLTVKSTQKHRVCPCIIIYLLIIVLFVL